jgi:hypothetical protein
MVGLRWIEDESAMMLACLPFAVLLPLLPAMTSQAAEPAPAVAGTKDQRVAAAADAYGQANFAAAAVAFESLYRDYPGEPRFLFNAGASRYAAHHYAHAALHFSEYTLRPDIQDSDRKDAQAQLNEARNRVASVQLTVRVPAGARDEVTFIVRRVARGPLDQRPELQFTAPPVGDVATLSVQVDPGVWAVQLRGPSYTTTDQSFEVRGLGPQRLDLQLAQAGSVSSLQPSSGPAAAAPPGRARQYAVSLGVTGGVTSVVGVGILAAGLAKRRQLAVCDDDELVCQDNLSGALTIRDAGAATLGLGVGVLAGGLVWFNRDPALRRKLWLGGGVVGGLASIGGIAGLVVASHSYNSANAARVTDWDAHYNGPGKAPLRATSAAILGLGLGLVTSSVTSLFIQRRTNPGLRALRIDGAASPWLTGLVVSGRF